jgi:hypothetical protein
MSISAPRAAKLRARDRSSKIDFTRNIAAVPTNTPDEVRGAYIRMLHVLPLIGVLLGGYKLCQGMSPGH